MSGSTIEEKKYGTWLRKTMFELTKKKMIKYLDGESKDSAIIENWIVLGQKIKARQLRELKRKGVNVTKEGKNHV